MMTAKVFENGRSQAVRLPKECRFNTDEVAVNKIGEIVLLVPKSSKWNSFMQAPYHETPMILVAQSFSRRSAPILRLKIVTSLFVIILFHPPSVQQSGVRQV